MTTSLAFYLAAAVGASYLITRWVRAHAIRNAIFDTPNHRSLHMIPTPRGGGVALAAVTLGGVLLSWIAGALPNNVAAALVGGGFLVATIGRIDDQVPQRSVVRLIVHLAAAIWAVVWLNGMPSIHLGQRIFELGMFGSVIAVLGIMWSTNLYNFMDGIDGIAAGEAAFVGMGAGTLLLFAGNPGLAMVCFLIAASSLGFLFWNWPPAAIFMGDVGSGLLGFFFGTLALASENSRAVPLVLWVILLLVFVFDATTTLVRRGLLGYQLDAAHKDHAYQRAVLVGWTHAQVTTAVLVVSATLGIIAAIGFVYPSFVQGAIVASFLIVFLIYGLVERKRPMAKRHGVDPSLER